MAADKPQRNASDKPAPPAANPNPGTNPGYAENQPRDVDEARKPAPTRPANPDDGGLGREPESGPDPSDRS